MLVLRTSSLRTSSLLCALENVGYGRLLRDSRKEAAPDRLAVSTLGIEDLRGGALCEVEAEMEERTVDSGS